MPVLSTLVVFHKDFDWVYSPSCPACQLTNNPGSHTNAMSVAALIPPPVLLSFMPFRCESPTPRVYHAFELIPRSPPARICS
jgi:hypothetical protein